MKKVFLFVVVAVLAAHGQTSPVQSDILQGGDAYTVRKLDSNSLGKMRTSRYYGGDSGWSSATATKYGRWTENKGFKLFDNLNDSGTIWFNPLGCKDTGYYIPQFLVKGQVVGWLHRRINWTLTNVDSFIEIPRQN
jgi:hypothetical protein